MTHAYLACGHFLCVQSKNVVFGGAALKRSLSTRGKKGQEENDRF